ncbi:MAG: glucose-1-phosphate thymidylyltransferase RfbA [Chlamydiia bacterium]|nr:glucose-1-phosphate thymidylyltransferase RfbA [Chlamydiia bacterium]
MKGIILAAGKGTRLHPITLALSKQLVPIYNKPMIYYPLATLMSAGIQDILIITNPADQEQFKRLLQDGSQWGISLSYATQETPHGLADAFLIGKEFIGNDPVCLILGDNLFYGEQISTLLAEAFHKTSGATLFAYPVKNPSRYGVVDWKSPPHIIEKPDVPPSEHAVTGLYVYDNQVISIAESLKPSARGEIEITDINNHYLKNDPTTIHQLGRGTTWLDAGTYESLMQASQFVHVIEERQGLMIANLEEIAYTQNWISKEQLLKQAHTLANSAYGDYLLNEVAHA